jgi:hypothetical protein
MKTGSSQPATIVLLEDLLWGDLEPSEKAELLQRFLHVAASRGARMASCPILGYSSVDPLLAAKFRRYKRVLHTYLTFWNGFQPVPLSGLYIDVL